MHDNKTFGQTITEKIIENYKKNHNIEFLADCDEYDLCNIINDNNLNEWIKFILNDLYVLNDINQNIISHMTQYYPKKFNSKFINKLIVDNKVLISTNINVLENVLSNASKEEQKNITSHYKRHLHKLNKYNQIIVFAWGI